MWWRREPQGGKRGCSHSGPVQTREESEPQAGVKVRAERAPEEAQARDWRTKEDGTGSRTGRGTIEGPSRHPGLASWFRDTHHPPSHSIIGLTLQLSVPVRI